MIPLSKIQVSPVKEKQFEKKHITCVEELATFFPRKYQDFRTKKKIKDLMDGDVCRIDGVVTHIYDNAKFSLQHHLVWRLFLQGLLRARRIMDLLW